MTTSLSDAGVAAALAEIEALRDDEASPDWVRRIARAGLERLHDMQAKVNVGDQASAEEINRSFSNLIPAGLRGIQTFAESEKYIVVDDATVPPTVTIHWERVPRRLRGKTASLASAYVDLFAPPPSGGRAKKSAKKASPETGSPG